MSNENATVRVFKLWAKISMMVVDGRRDATTVADALQVILDRSTPSCPSWREEDGITINHGRFNPAEFIGQGWITIADETDTRSSTLTEMDLTKVQQVTMLRDGESYIKGEEKLNRLKKLGNIRLDADIFLTLWENQHRIPESWKEKVNGNTRFVCFEGTVLRGPSGIRYVLYLYWNDGQWHWGFSCLGGDWRANNPSVVLAG